MKKDAISVVEGGPRAWAAQLESELVSPMFKEPCKQKPEMNVARARAGLKLQKDKKAGGGRRGRERQKDWTIQAGRIEKGKSVESRGEVGSGGELEVRKPVLRARNTPTRCENWFLEMLAVSRMYPVSTEEKVVS